MRPLRSNGPTIVPFNTFASALALLVGLAGCTPGPSTGQEATARNVLLFIADGAGTSTWSLARTARGADLAVAGMPVGGLVDTRDVDGGITDSAAGATAYAIGMRTFNGAIGVDASCRALLAEDSLRIRADPASCGPQPTLLERAEAVGKATGLITTTWVTDATPAAFAAHSPSRYMHPTIARQMMDSGVDVLMGGGRQVFDGTGRQTAGDLLATACADVDCPRDAAELAALDSSDRRLIGLFAADDLPAAAIRKPDLPTMTEVALDRLSKRSEGFFLMVETEGTDTEQHANASVEVIRDEIVQLDQAVQVALDFARRTPGTLVVVTSDHETGGMALTRSGGEWSLAYVQGSHTGTMVPLFAEGPGADLLSGIHDNDEVGRILRKVLLGEDATHEGGVDDDER